METKFAIGLDVGGTDIKAALVDSHGRIVAKCVQPTEPDRGPDPVLDDMAGMVRQLIDQADVARDLVVGVGIGTPGPLSPSRGVVIRAANLPKFQNVPMRDEIARRTGLPAVFDNDANAAAYGEFWVGAARDVQDMVLLTLGTGVGAGVVLGGRLLHGHFENAAELGHMIVQPGGIPCSCGQRGCLEQYSSASGVARRAAAALGNGSASILTEVAAAPNRLTAKHVAEAVCQGDELALKIWDEACLYLALACINTQHAFNPAVVVLGGGMSAAGAILVDTVRHHLIEQRWSLAEDVPEVVLARLGNDAGIIGTAGLMLADAGYVDPRRER